MFLIPSIPFTFNLSSLMFNSMLLITFLTLISIASEVMLIKTLSFISSSSTFLTHLTGSFITAITWTMDSFLEESLET